MWATTAAALAGSTIGCGSLLDMAPPVTAKTGSQLASQGGAEAQYGSAKSQLLHALATGRGIWYMSGAMADEFTQVGVSNSRTPQPAPDARLAIDPSLGAPPTDFLLAAVFGARSSLLLAQEALAQYEPASGQHMVGEAFALVGYAELVLAEDFCAGSPLDRVLPGGGFEYGMPLSTDSLFGVAEAHFDSAAAHANGDTTIAMLAHVGLARTRLGRGNYEGADSAAALVSTTFNYTIPIASGDYPTPDLGPSFCTSFGMANREGGNGIDYVASSDPRLASDSTGLPSCDGAFGLGGPTMVPFTYRFGSPITALPLATGVEARLIQAEAALQAHDPDAWASYLNALRAFAPSSFVHTAAAIPALTADSTSGASDSLRVTVTFRERAIWLYGLGTRLGDMRRLVRQHGRAIDAVYPVGTYRDGHVPNVATFGNAVALSLPTDPSSVTNPHYQGCLVPVTQP
jgi:hypothetical protein